MFGMQQSIPNLVREQQLRWLGHVGHMDPDRMPEQLVFGQLKKRPRHGAKRRWRDVVNSDVGFLGVTNNCYNYWQDQKEWYQLHTEERICQLSDSQQWQPTRSYTEL